MSRRGVLRDEVSTAMEPPTAVVVVDEVALRPVTRRRSSVSVAPPPVATAAAAKAPPLVAGDQLARPHFLKDRSMTMRPDVGLSVASHAALPSHHQSKASAFLVKLVESARSATPPYDATKGLATQPPTGNNGGGAAPRPQSGEGSDATQAPQRRRQSIVISESHVTKLNQLQHQNTMPAVVPVARSSVPSGVQHLTSHDEEDEPEEYVTETELRDRPLAQLVRDMGLYNKRSGTLLRILNEIQRRLHAAEFDSNVGRSSHVDMSRELVDDGLLAAIVLVLREFRFHVALQTAAVALLSFLAEVSDLYAYMMAELDIEPLVQKIVAVHVSQERLVMNGSSLMHTISERKHKSHVLKMLKARQLEKEKKRAASFVEAFAAERKQSRARGLEGAGTRGGAVVEQDNTQLLRSDSRWQPSALSGRLGSPPVLTAHYDLAVSLSRQRSSLIPPIDRENGFDDGALRLDASLLCRRPKTSPDPRLLMGQSSAARLAAIYLKPTTIVETSSQRKRAHGSRKTRSAITPKRLPSAGTNGTAEKSIDPSYNPCVNCDGTNPEAADAGDAKPDASGADSEASSPSSFPGEKGECDDSVLAYGESAPEEETTYDDEEFDNEDEDQHSLLARAETTGNGDRLLPVGSDSDLLELVDRSGVESVESPDPSSFTREEESFSALLSLESSSLSGTSVDGAQSTAPSRSSIDQMVTNELVDLLSSCVDPGDPTASLKPNNDYVGRTVCPTTTPEEKNGTPLIIPPLASMHLSALVRPVSKRIIGKAAKKNRKQHTKQSHMQDHPSNQNSSPATAQITAMLVKVREPGDGYSTEESPCTVVQDTDAVVGMVRSPPEESTIKSSVLQIQALYARGLQHHKQNELDAAIRCYEQAIHMQHSGGVKREFASLYINLGSARMAQGRLYDALVAFTQAERIQPRNVKATFNSGLVLMQLKQWEAALAKLDLVTASDPDHLRAQRAREQCRLAVAQIQPPT